MILTQSNLICGLSKRQSLILRMMCLFSNNLYNVALYNIRQYYFAEKLHLRYEANYHVTKNNENYKLLQAGVSQQTMKVVDRAFQSFFALITKARKDDYRFQAIRLPHYRKKGALFNLILQSNAISISKDGFLNVPMSNAFMNIYGREKIKIRVPQRILAHKLKEVRIIPICGGRLFKIRS